MKYEAVFVDWDGTLSDSRFWDRWRDDPERAEKYGKIQNALFETVTGKRMLKFWMTGFWDYKQILTYVNESTGVSYGELENELRYSAENMKLIDDKVLDQVRQLRDIGKQVVIATDNMDTFDLWTVPALELNDHFDDILNSSSVKLLKGAASPFGAKGSFFSRYLKQMSIAPENTVLIDNSRSAKSVEGAGMNFMHVNNRHSLSDHLSTILEEY